MWGAMEFDQIVSLAEARLNVGDNRDEYETKSYFSIAHREHNNLPARLDSASNPFVMNFFDENNIDPLDAMTELASYMFNEYGEHIPVKHMMSKQPLLAYLQGSFLDLAMHKMVRDAEDAEEAVREAEREAVCFYRRYRCFKY